MKKGIVIASFFGLLVLLSCKKETPASCFKIKYINGLCGTQVYQILDANYYVYGQNNWTNPIEGGTVNNVFTLKNQCQNLILDTDGTATVKITESLISNCALCLAVYPGIAPTKVLAVEPCLP